MYPVIFWGDLLRNLRESHSILQKELAPLLHTTRQSYSNLETGRSRPTPEQLAVLSNIYHVNLLDYVNKCLPEEYLREQRDFWRNREYHAKQAESQPSSDISGFGQTGPGRPRRQATLFRNNTGKKPLDLLRESHNMVAEADYPYNPDPRSGS